MKKKPFEKRSKTVLFVLFLVLIAPHMSMADDATYYYDKGTDFLGAGKLHEAIATLSTAIDLRPEYATAYNNRGLAYYKQNKYEKAVEDFQKAIQLNPNDVLAYNNAAVVFCRQGDYDKALLYLHNAIALIKKIKPSHTNVFNNLGFVYMNKGMHEASAAAYKYANHIMQNKTADDSDNYSRISLDQWIDGHPVTAKFYEE
jgi:tetratricopeptide (TPR) repeat protein